MLTALVIAALIAWAVIGFFWFMLAFPDDLEYEDRLIDIFMGGPIVWALALYFWIDETRKGN